MVFAKSTDCEASNQNLKFCCLSRRFQDQVLQPNRRSSTDHPILVSILQLRPRDLSELPPIERQNKNEPFFTIRQCDVLHSRLVVVSWRWLYRVSPSS